MILIDIVFNDGTAKQEQIIKDDSCWRITESNCLVIKREIVRMGGIEHYKEEIIYPLFGIKEIEIKLLESEK